MTVGDAAVAWLGRADLASQTNCATQIDLVIRDFRAKISDLSRTVDELHVSCQGVLANQIYVHVRERDYQGNLTRFSQRIVDGHAALPISPALSEIQVFLVTADGECLDEYSEIESQRTHLYSLLLAPRPASAFSHELTEAVAAGENETTEFKEWIPPGRGAAKSAELLKVASAFSNSRGAQFLLGSPMTSISLAPTVSFIN